MVGFVCRCLQLMLASFSLIEGGGGEGGDAVVAKNDLSRHEYLSRGIAYLETDDLYGSKRT